MQIGEPVALEREIEGLLRLSVEAACQADIVSDPWLKAQLQAIAKTYKEIAEKRIGPLSGPSLQTGGKKD